MLLVHRPVAGARHHQATQGRSAGRRWCHQCLHDGGCGRASVADDNLHPRPRRCTWRRATRKCLCRQRTFPQGPQPTHPPFFHIGQRTGVAGIKRVQPVGVHLLHITRAVHVPAHTTSTPAAPAVQRATATASSRFCGPSGEWDVAGRMAHRSAPLALCASKSRGNTLAKKECRFLQRIGAVRDHHEAHIGPDQVRGDALRQQRPVR